MEENNGENQAADISCLGAWRLLLVGVDGVFSPNSTAGVTWRARGIAEAWRVWWYGMAWRTIANKWGK